MAEQVDVRKVVASLAPEVVIYPLEAQLQAFARWVLAEHRESFGDLDGWAVQDKAEELGLLVRRTLTEPCGENCECACNVEPPYECLFLREGLHL